MTSEGVRLHFRACRPQFPASGGVESPRARSIRRRLPCLPSPADFDAMPCLQPLVGAFGLVWRVNSALSQATTRRTSLNITETNRRIAEQFNEAFNRGDLDAAASCFAED